MNASTSGGSPHVWKFFRTGGLEQVLLENADDLRHLRELDQKLWVALSCPVKGLELDERTLALIDTDHDGRIRVPELLAAVEWAVARLRDPGVLLAGGGVLPVEAILDTGAEGELLRAAARRLLALPGRPAGAPAGELTVDDVADPAKLFAADACNGDGVVPPQAAEDPVVQALIRDILATVGGTADRSGAQGVTAAQAAAFQQAVAEHVAWLDAGAAPAVSPLGDATGAAVAAVRAVRAKVEDYFVRGRLAAFDGRALAALNRPEAEYLAVAAQELALNSAELAAFPLARVAAGAALPLVEGVNPAWAAALAELRRAAVAPLLGPGKSALTEEEWRGLTARLAAYEAWLDRKAGAVVERLGAARVRALAAGLGRRELETLIARDLAHAAEFQAVGDLAKLLRYARDLRTLLRNFVNFADFYARDRQAVFQAGRLFLDSRSTVLCVRVDGPNPLAAMSKAYIAYCQCTRAGSPPLTIAACFTQGDSDYLFVGRHGVFYDRQGRDWDAVITSIVENPISIRQAFGAPYKKFIRLVEEQVARRAAAADGAAGARLAGTAEQVAHLDKAKLEAPPKKIDVGAVAAIGVAITGAISALTLILGYVFGMKAWQYPLVLLGLVAVISGPSMIIAWLKLRQRTLGPILEGSGWAVNGRVKINLPLGSALTDLAHLPPRAERLLNDPYEDKEAARRTRRLIVLLVVLVLAGAAIFVRWDRLHRGHYFWEAPIKVAQ
jgi:hypothetical protein